MTLVENVDHRARPIEHLQVNKNSPTCGQLYSEVLDSALDYIVEVDLPTEVAFDLMKFVRDAKGFVLVASEPVEGDPEKGRFRNHLTAHGISNGSMGKLYPRSSCHCFGSRRNSR